MAVLAHSRNLDTGARTRPAVGGSHGWFVWGLSVVFVVYLFGFQTGYSVVNPNIQKEVGLTIVQVGTIATIYTWAFAICQLFSGPLLDRLGSRAVIPPAMALVAVGIFLFASGQSYEAFIAAQIVLAMGACAGFVGAGYVGGQWFGVAKFSFMFGLVQFAASLFSAFGQNLIAVALDYLYWRDLFYFIAGFGLVLFIAGAIFIRNPVPVEGPGLSEGLGNFVRGVIAAILEVIRIPHVIVAAFWGAMVFGAILACGVLWAPKLLAARGMPEQLATFSSSVMWLGLALGCLTVPKWSDIVRRRKLPTLAGVTLQLLALAGLIYLPPIGAELTFALCFLFGVGAAAHMLAFSTAADVVPPRLIGTSAAIVNGIMFLVSGILISLPGEIVTKQVNVGEPVEMSLVAQAANPLIIGLVIGLILALLMRETYPRHEEPPR
jgi:MFS family permease